MTSKQHGGLERRAFQFAGFKALDETAGTFEGYLAVFSNVDEGGDSIEPGAFRKTLGDLETKQRAQNIPYILPIFWQHDPSEPIGGFIQAREDEHGLYVKGQLDLDIPQGMRAYSGMKRKYLTGMSIGYITVKQGYADGVRLLKELRLLEGSIVSIPMNAEAQVTAIKSASGKADWPLGERDTAWDGAGAHNRIVKWATKDDGSIDTGKLKSVHFWYDESAADKITSYKLLFCDLISGDVKAMPKGIFACAGAHGVEGADIPSGDVAGVKAKIEAYYKRMAKAFDDDSIVAPWAADSGKGMQTMPTGQHPRKARDFDTLFQSLNAADDLQDEWGDTFIAFTHAMSELMWQVQAQQNGWVPDGMPQVDAQEATQANLDAFSKAVLDLVQRSAAASFAPSLDSDGDQFLDPDGCNARDADSDMAMATYMSQDTRHTGRKAGRVLSAANHDHMSTALQGMRDAHTSMNDHMKSMQDLLDATKPSNAGSNNDSNGNNADAGDTSDNGGNGGKSAYTRPGAGAGAASTGALDSSTTPTANTNNDDDEQARLMALKIKMRLQAMRLAHEKVGAA